VVGFGRYLKQGGKFMAEDNGKAGPVLVSFILGGLIGAALGVLFAPRSGKQTREKLNEWIDETVEKGKDRAEKLGEELKHRKEQLVQAFSKKEGNA